MNRFNKVMILLSLVALIGAQNAVAIPDSRVKQIQDKTKQFSRDLATFSKCLRTGKPCDPEIKARLMQGLQVIGGLTVAVIGTAGAVISARAVKRAMDFPAIGSVSGLETDEFGGKLEGAITESGKRNRAVQQWETSQAGIIQKWQQKKKQEEEKRLQRIPGAPMTRLQQDLADRAAYIESLGELPPLK